MSSDIRFFQYVRPHLWCLRLIFRITTPISTAALYRNVTAALRSGSDMRADSQRATLLTAPSGREWNILIRYGHWIDCGKGFGIVCTAKRGLKGMTTEGRKGETLIAVITTIVRIHFRCFNIKNTNIPSWEATSSRAFKKFTNCMKSKVSFWC
jgi:hypothetical protein